MKIWTYHRCSTDSQDNQLARDTLREAAARLGGELVVEVEETGSGGRNDRPGLQRVMEAARAREFDCLLVWAVDRFARSTVDLLANVQTLQKCGVRFIASAQGLDLKPEGDPTSELMLTMLAAVATFERAIIRQRVKMGLAKAKIHGTRSGKPIGRPPTTPQSRKDMVKRLRRAGASWNQIARTLDMSKSAVRRAA